MAFGFGMMRWLWLHDQICTFAARFDGFRSGSQEVVPSAVGMFCLV